MIFRAPEGPPSVSYLFPFMAKPTVIAIGSLFVACFAASAMFLVHIAHPRVVGRAVTPDGVEACIVQECNWGPELFTTSFVYHKPGLEWRRFYYDHQDIYWGTARATLDTNAHVAVFYRGRSPAVTFHWDSEIYRMHRWNRTLTNAQWQMPASWNPDLPVYAHQ